MSSYVFGKLAPFALDELKEIRMHILEEMCDKGFPHYLGQMQHIVNSFASLSDEDILNDDLWKRTDPYWMTESPWLYKLYRGKKLKRLGLVEPGGITTATSFVMKGPFVQNLVGDPYWMTVQQKILFKTMLRTYFSNDSRLFPIALNMDFVYLMMGSETPSTPPPLTQEEIDKRVSEWHPPQMLEISRQSTSTVHSLTRTMREKYRKSLEAINKMSPSARQEMGTTKRVFKSALAGAGPFILKVLQQVNTANENKVNGTLSVAELTKDIFSNIPALTPQEADYVFANMDLPKTYLENMNPQVLGSASIAEAHITHNSELDIPAIIKFIKPMYAYYFLCEVDFLLTTFWKALRHSVEKAAKDLPKEERAIKSRVWLLQTRQLLMFFVREFTKEFNYQQEWRNTTVGYDIYNRPSQNVRSIVALALSKKPFPALVLQKVNGVNLDKIINDPSTTHDEFVALYKSVMGLINIWFTNTLWGTGFFHADLHPGNLIKDGDTLYVIDFGSCGQLTKRQQCQLVDVMYLSSSFHLKVDGDERKHKENLVLAREFVLKIWAMCQVAPQTRDHLDFVASKILNYGKGLYFSTMFLDIVEFSNSIGVCVSNDVLLFGRGVAYLGSIMAKLTKKCDDEKNCPPYLINGIIQKNLIKNPIQLYKLATGKLKC